MDYLTNFLPYSTSRYDIIPLHALVCTLVFFLMRILAPFLFKDYSSVPKAMRLEVWNRGTAIFHATFMFALACTYWSTNPTYEIREEQSGFEALCIDVMTGYMIYDTFVEGILTSPVQPLIIVHHALGLYTHILARFTHNSLLTLLIMMVYLAESSTPFVHLGWLFHQLKMKDTFMFKVFALFALLNFFFFRILWGPYLLYTLWTNMELMEGKYEIIVPCFVSIVGFIFLNMVWFSAMIRIALKSFKKAAEKKKE